MILSERLLELDPDAYVKIGTKEGAGWLYGGQVKNFVPEIYDEDARKDLVGCIASRQQRLIGYIEKNIDVKSPRKLRRFGNTVKQACERLADTMDSLRDIKPIAEREVVAEWPADGEDALNIEVDGFGDGKAFAARPIDKHKPIAADGAMRLIGAIYALDCEDLIRLYFKKLHKKGKLSAHDQERAAELEEKLRSDKWGQFAGDGTAMIRECKRIAREKYECTLQDDGTVLCEKPRFSLRDFEGSPG